MDLESLPAIWCRGLTPTGNASEKSKRWIWRKVFRNRTNKTVTSLGHWQ